MEPVTAIVVRRVRLERVGVGESQAEPVADIAAGIATVLDARSLSYNVYNVSAGGWTTLEDVIKALTELRPSLQVVDDPDKEFAILPRGGSRGAIDVTRLREDLGFSAGYDLKAGLGDYLDWRESFGFLD